MWISWLAPMNLPAMNSPAAWASGPAWLAQASLRIHGEIALESVDGGLEYADIGVDATHVEISPTVLVNELRSFGCEQCVDVLVDHRCARADVGYQFGDEFGVRSVSHLSPANQPLERATGVVKVPAEDHVAARGLPSVHEGDAAPGSPRSSIVSCRPAGRARR